jgi:hypothetical protein
MATVSLPPALEARLAAVAARVRRLRVVRGASWVAVAGLLAGVVLVLLDAAIGLPVLARCLLQLAWLGLVGVLAWRLVVRPWREEVPLEEVARRVERQFPGLGERLLTVVSLRERTGPAHGSPHLVASLARETEQHTRGLDFAAAVPVRPVARLAAGAAALLLLCVASVAVMPNPGERLRRVGLPWYRPTAVAPYRVVVSSGSPVVRRGDPVTLTAYLDRTDPAAAVPDSAVLVFGDGRRLPMTGDGSAAFHVTLPGVADDFEYRVEVGPAASDRFTVLVADPVELADGTTAEIVPPAYAASSVPTRLAPGLIDLDGLQHSTASLRLRFTRPAATAFLEWHPDDATPGPGVVLPLNLDPDRTGASATVPMPQAGTLRVVLVNETGPRRLRTDVPIPVRVTPDAPPHFEQVSGLSARPRAARPYDRVLVTFATTDDVGVGTAELEYAVGPGFVPVRVPVPLAGAGTPRAEGRVLFDLADKAAEGQKVLLRVRVADTRRLADPPLAPQVAVYPPAGWAEFTLSASAPPLDQQEVFGQRDELQKALADASKEITQAEDEAGKLRADTVGHSPLPIDHRIRLDRIGERVIRATDSLRAAARDAGLAPELRPLAASVRDVADRPLGSAADHLRLAKTDSPAERVAALGAAGTDLADARARIEELLGRNVRVAQERLDRRRLEALSVEQTALADKLKAGAAPLELRAAQNDLRKRLRGTIDESEPLRRSTEGAAGRQLRALAADTRSLGAALREFDAASREATAAARRKLLAQAAEAQTESIAAATKSIARLETAARIAGVRLPTAADFRRAADLIAADKLVEAQVELEKLAADLDHAAEVFDEWADGRKDAKRAARQLALWQDDLRTRVIAATKATPFAQLPEAVKAGFGAEQRAIRDAAARLKLPPDTPVTDARREALLALARAVEEVDGDGARADPTMKAAADALHQLEAITPAADTRRAKARAELDRIRIDQDAVLALAEPAVRGLAADRPIDAAVMQALAKRLAAAQEKQQQLALRLAALDLPGFEPRQARAAFVMRLAAADLRDGTPFDLMASIHWAKRELERLRQALDVPPAPDDLIDELAARQAAIAKDLAALGPTPTSEQLQRLAIAQREVQKRFEFFSVPEAPALLNDATEAVRLAEHRDGMKADEWLRRTTAAATALRRLADRMNGRETDVDRVRRLAAHRTAAAEEAKKLAGTKFNPEASDAAKRQLLWEIDELTHTRVGPNAQGAKREALRQYTELYRQTEPDRQAATQKALAATLDGLAARMAETGELAFPRPPVAVPPGVPPEDTYLPSRPLAEELRGLARRQRAVRDRVNAIDPELAQQVKPAAAEQAPREAELARRAAGLADRLDAAAKDLPAGDPAINELTAAAGKAREAAAKLTDAAEKDRNGMAAEAAKLRVEADKLLSAAAEKSAMAAGMMPGTAPMPEPDPSAAAMGDSLREAEQAMQAAGRKLDAGDAAGAEAEMRKAVEALNRAAQQGTGVR